MALPRHRTGAYGLGPRLDRFFYSKGFRAQSAIPCRSAPQFSMLGKWVPAGFRVDWDNNLRDSLKPPFRGYVDTKRQAKHNVPHSKSAASLSQVTVDGKTLNCREEIFPQASGWKRVLNEGS